ncbi:hypothetical protein [Chryseobacterium rhizosphaerae]|uniref:hypothetical protein n=1 Tax=Chryseobacterium rhizosphaerae TaxID=395937 RepID=UPI0023598E94|nr:hypothetical protein [Chryseobacterium rhizosphaerae]MDC8102342.1 hypothetical protein [Chryseobacterium rhizosphaerae]
MKRLILLMLPILCFSQNKENYSEYLKKAMDDIKNKDFATAILNLDKGLRVNSNDPVSLYFKGYSQIIIEEKENGCKTLIDAIYHGSNNAKKIYAEKCIDYNPKLNIDKFKSGKFSLQILDANPLIYTFERKNDIQYESYEDKIYTGKIIWLGNSDYKIIADQKTGEIMTENPDFIIRVLKIERNKYLYERIEDTQVQFGVIKKL